MSDENWTTRGVQPLAVHLTTDEARGIASANGAVRCLGWFPTEYVFGREGKLYRARADKPEAISQSFDEVFDDPAKGWYEVTGPVALARLTMGSLLSQIHAGKVSVNAIERASAEVRDAFAAIVFSLESLSRNAFLAVDGKYPPGKVPPVVLHAHRGSCDVQVFDGVGEGQIVCLGCELSSGRNVLFVEHSAAGDIEDRWEHFAAHMVEHLRVLTEDPPPPPKPGSEVN